MGDDISGREAALAFGKMVRSPARAIPTPGSVIWAPGIFSIGIYNRKYFLGPKNSSRGRNCEGVGWGGGDVPPLELERVGCPAACMPASAQHKRCLQPGTLAFLLEKYREPFPPRQTNCPARRRMPVATGSSASTSSAAGWHA